MYAKQKLAVYLNKSVRGNNLSVKLKSKSRKQESRSKKQETKHKMQESGSMKRLSPRQRPGL